MYVKQIEQIEVVEASDAKEFQTRVNSFLRKMASEGKKAQLMVDPSAWLKGYIKWYDEEREPETIVEEYELVGETHTCGECQHFPLITDGRIKNVRCPITEKLTRKERACCDAFYKEVLGLESKHQG